MHMGLAIIAIAKNAEDATEHILKGLDDLTKSGDTSFDYHYPAEWEGEDAEKLAKAIPYDDPDAKRLLEEQWGFFKRDLFESMDSLRDMFNQFTNEELFTEHEFDLWMHDAYRIGQYEGPAVRVYWCENEHLTGIKGPEMLDSMLKKWEDVGPKYVGDEFKVFLMVRGVHY